MGLASRHRGWNYDQQHAILGAVLKGTIAGSQALGANTADQDGMLVGTPVSVASPVDTMFTSNTQSGDVVEFVLLGATNSTEVRRIDTSAGLHVFNEVGADFDHRFEGDNNTNMLVLDGGTDSAALGRAVVTGAFLSVDGSTVNRAPVTSVGLGVHLPAATYTKPAAASATTAIVPVVYIGTPTMVATTNAATYSDAITLYVAGVPAASTNVTATRAWASVVNGRFGVGAPAAIVHDLNTATLAVLNEQGADIDFRVEGDNNANMLLVDAGTDTGAIGRAVVSGAFLSIDGSAVDRTQVTQVGSDVHLPAATINDNGAAATKAIWGRVVLRTPTLTSTNAVTYSDAASLYIAAAPVASGNVTITRGWAAWIDGGNLRLDGDLYMDDAGHDLRILANTAAAFEIYDGTTKILALDSRNASNGTISYLLTPIPMTIAEASGFAILRIAASTQTVSKTSPNNVISSIAGLGFQVSAQTLNATSNVTTITTASSIMFEKLVAGTNMTITNSRIIDTNADAYLTAAGVWTDNACTMEIKEAIGDMTYDDLRVAMKPIRPVNFDYKPSHMPGGTGRHGILAEELPEFLVDTGQGDRKSVGSIYLAAFNLAATKLLYEELEALKKQVREQKN